MLDSLLTVPLATFSTLQALYKSLPHFPPIKIKPFNYMSLEVSSRGEKGNPRITSGHFVRGFTYFTLPKALHT